MTNPTTDRTAYTDEELKQALARVLAERQNTKGLITPAFSSIALPRQPASAIKRILPQFLQQLSLNRDPLVRLAVLRGQNRMVKR